LLSLAAALVCAACAASPALVPASTSPPPDPGGVAVVSAQVGDWTFSTPTPDDMRAMATGFGFSGDLILAFRPSISRSISSAVRLENGNHELEVHFPSPFGDGWATASALTARVPAPAAGGVAQFVETTVRPMLAAWAPDGALFTGYMRMPDLAAQRGMAPPRSHDPNATQNEAAIVKNVGWPLAYVSPSRHEVLFFYEAGVVLRTQWTPKRFDAASVPVSKQAAIATVVAALRDPAAQSEEARTGRDYFVGTPYAGIFGPAPEVNRHDDLVPTYDVPDAVDWNGFVGTEWAEKPVWLIGSTWGGGGWVDARTGTLIRFTRLRVGHGTGGMPSPYVPPAP
jgi:hypothetical protein